MQGFFYLNSLYLFFFSLVFIILCLAKREVNPKYLSFFLTCIVTIVYICYMDISTKRKIERLENEIKEKQAVLDHLKDIHSGESYQLKRAKAKKFYEHYKTKKPLVKCIATGKAQNITVGKKYRLGPPGPKYITIINNDMNKRRLYKLEYFEICQ